MKKELRPVHDNVTCDVCGRTMLKGETVESFLAPGGKRQRVCKLCFARAEQYGWIRESVAGDVPTRVARPEQRRPLLGRLRRRRREVAPEATESEAEGGEPIEEPAEDAGNGAAPVEEPAPPPEAPRSRPRDPRHVRAVPTTGDVKVERALELFNQTEHQNTIAGVARTLGPPWVSAFPDIDQPSTVTLVVAWELSWYRFRIDLGDEAHAVALLEKGEELSEIDEELREWNATMDSDGLVVAGVGSGS